MLYGQNDGLNTFKLHLNDENAKQLLYFSVNSWLCSISFIIDMCDPTDITPILYESFFNINSSYSSFGSFKDSTILLPISSWW